jgi:methyl-accepting chemotaxis protein
MKNLTLQQKIVYPLLVTFALILSIGSWYFVSAQIHETEAWYRDELLTLAAASGYMPHVTADEFMQTRGLRFHRILASGNSRSSKRNELERRAADAFDHNPDLKFFFEEISVNDTVFMVVFTPTTMKRECVGCHADFDLGGSSGPQKSKVVALFGSSGPMTEIHNKETRIKIIIFSLTLLVITGLGWIIHRSMRLVLLDPMNELKFQTEAVAGRDLRKITTPALERKLASHDEMGHVTRSFATMILMLRTTIRRLHDASLEVAQASAHIGSNIELMAAGSQEQTIQTNEVSNAMGEMTKTIMENSKSASETVETARKARLTAEAGGIIVSATAEGMKRIVIATGKSSEIVQALERSSKQIGEIIKLINDIADQTSLLALNAATEAARAGEEGRGFAIVADEVRKLSERTMKATKEIERMIKNIQQESGQAVSSMDEGMLEVKEGIKLADQAGQALQKIVEITQKVTDMVSQIAAACEEQSGTSEQIFQNVGIIHSVTKQMADSTKEVASASEGLNQLTEQLQKMVTEFKFDDDTGSPENRNFGITKKQYH